MEKIIAIKEFEEVEGYSSFEGYEVVTTKQSIKMSISNDQNCCENWGYFWSNDSFDDFIGAELLDVSITDSSLNKAKMLENNVDSSSEYFEGSIMFVNLETSEGTLQFVVYNKHNGYYSHTAKIECTQLEYKVSL